MPWQRGAKTKKRNGQIKQRAKKKTTIFLHQPYCVELFRDNPTIGDEKDVSPHDAMFLLIAAAGGGGDKTLKRQSHLSNHFLL